MGGGGVEWGVRDGVGVRGGGEEREEGESGAGLLFFSLASKESRARAMATSAGSHQGVPFCSGAGERRRTFTCVHGITHIHAKRQLLP